MGIKFNADEILGIAERIEDNGAKYYRAAAEKFGSSPAKALLLKLAEMEEGHKNRFSSMRKELGVAEKEPTVKDHDGELAGFIQALADGNVFDHRQDPAKVLSGHEKIEDVLRAAIGMEKDSVIFYLGLRDLVPSGAGRERVEAIIREELSHISAINREFKRSK